MPGQLAGFSGSLHIFLSFRPELLIQNITIRFIRSFQTFLIGTITLRH